MIPVKTNMTEVDNLPGEEIEFSISDPRWVMRSLADLYSDRELACIREYSTNARDAMIEAGKGDKPIVVTLPSVMDPYFTVQDFGVGMSETELKEIYTKFGDSTKRDSNDFNGMLGFGSKSAVAYTNTFTVTAVKDGRKTVGVITRKEDYSIVLKIVLTVNTIEPNGVTIQIPVSNAQMFAQKARDFYRFWKPGTVEVDGSAPVWEVGEKLDEGLFYSPRDGVTYVVMGNVPYRVANPDALFPPGMRKISFVAYVENGAVEFTPNREDLKYSEHTKTALHEIIEGFVKKAIESAKAEVKAAKTHAEAYAAWTKWKNSIGKTSLGDLDFKGDKLIDEFKIDGMRYHANAGRYSTYAINTWTVEAMSSAIIVTGFVANLSSHHKTRAKNWKNLKGIYAPYIIFTQQDDVSSPWIDPSRVVDWEQLKADTPLPKKSRASGGVSWGRKAGTFDLISKNGREAEQDVPHTKELFYIDVQEFNKIAKSNSPKLKTILHNFDFDHRVVLVPANRKDKFLRNYKHAKPIMPYLKALVKTDGNSLLSEDAVKYLKMHEQDRNAMIRMDETKVLDPELKKNIVIAKMPENELLDEYHKHMRLCRMLQLAFTQHDLNGWNAKRNNYLRDNYPLHGGWSGVLNHANHVYIYLNAVYSARKDGKNV